MIVVGDKKAEARNRAVNASFAANAVRALWVIGLMYILGSLADVFLLWTLNKIPDNPAWELAALASTIEGTPRIVLGVALIWAATYIRGTSSLIIQRSLAVLLILLGVAGAAVGAMMVSDYFVLRGSIEPAQQTAFSSLVLKTLFLSGLHLVLLVPIGVLGVRRPRG